MWRRATSARIRQSAATARRATPSWKRPSRSDPGFSSSAPPAGHTLAPIPGDVWLLVEDNRAVVVPASEPDGAGCDAGRHAVYFTEMTTRPLAGDERDTAVRMCSRPESLQMVI